MMDYNLEIHQETAASVGVKDVQTMSDSKNEEEENIDWNSIGNVENNVSEADILETENAMDITSLCDPIASDVTVDGENSDDKSQDDSSIFELVNTEKDLDKTTNSSDGQDPDVDPIAADSGPLELENKEETEECIIPDDESRIDQNNKTNNESGTQNECKERFVVTNNSNQESTECIICKKVAVCKYCVSSDSKTSYICTGGCLDIFAANLAAGKTKKPQKDLRVKTFNTMLAVPKRCFDITFCRKCANCLKQIVELKDVLSWETMDFCTKMCLSKYQRKIGSKCASCRVNVSTNLLGKYCVRFGCILRQFCSSSCLEEYKKTLKVCSYCQEDMSGVTNGLAYLNSKGQSREFCTVRCMEKYNLMNDNRPRSNHLCSVCHEIKTVEVEYLADHKLHTFCSEPCFVAYKFVNDIVPGLCNMCKKYVNRKVLEQNSMMYDNSLYSFCSRTCRNIYTIAHRKIVPCSWCKVKKYNFDMIQTKSSSGDNLTLCSLNCLSLYQVSLNAVNSKTVNCDNCHVITKPMYHLTMSDATMRNFCSYPCVMAFQNQFPTSPITMDEQTPKKMTVPNKRVRQRRTATRTKKVNLPDTPGPMPIITSVRSLAPENLSNNDDSVNFELNAAPAPVTKLLLVKNKLKESQRNMATMVKPIGVDRSSEFKPDYVDKECQTDDPSDKSNIIPLPVPIFVPSPFPSFKAPFISPMPFPLPVQIPIFVPITKNTSSNVMKEMKKIKVRAPTDPFEAELLMMAELVASNAKKENVTFSESEEEDNAAPPAEEPAPLYSPEPIDNNSFGEDMLQMALNMANEFEEPAVDLEGALTANTITVSQANETTGTQENANGTATIPYMLDRMSLRGRKKSTRGSKTVTSSRRGRRSFNQTTETSELTQPQPPVTMEVTEKPDANMCLKYTFGVNAWKQWVTTKNADLEKMSRRTKLFKTEILQLTSDELNYSLCLFVKEVRKPNGAEYAPDTIYYLCLGIQQYLYENGRIDNIFCDTYYEKFTDCLDEVCKKFSVLYNDSHYIVTRVEEEHLWESKQLGAHSPHVLLSTLMFFNTKHFNLTTVSEHMQLSFSHIMKHWKRNQTQSGTPKSTVSRNVLLRFYPPQNSLEGTNRKKKVYEQQENEENPLRCPVKLYEFYLSKCPESVKTRNDVFYLMPERSCVPDSPVWYSTIALGQIALEKMLHRVKMVKEINVALLAS